MVMTIRYLDVDSNNLIVEKILSGNNNNTAVSCKTGIVPKYESISNNDKVIVLSLQTLPGCIANIDVKTVVIPSSSENNYNI